jgi:hypothetical protein
MYRHLNKFIQVCIFTYIYHINRWTWGEGWRSTVSRLRPSPVSNNIMMSIISRLRPSPVCNNIVIRYVLTTYHCEMICTKIDLIRLIFFLYADTQICTKIDLIRLIYSDTQIWVSGYPCIRMAGYTDERSEYGLTLTHQ